VKYILQRWEYYKGSNDPITEWWLNYIELWKVDYFQWYYMQ
jgi:hypothetical protein